MKIRVFVTCLPIEIRFFCHFLTHGNQSLWLQIPHPWIFWKVTRMWSQRDFGTWLMGGRTPGLWGFWGHKTSCFSTPGSWIPQWHWNVPTPPPATGPSPREALGAAAAPNTQTLLFQGECSPSLPSHLCMSTDKRVAKNTEKAFISEGRIPRIAPRLINIYPKCTPHKHTLTFEASIRAIGKYIMRVERTQSTRPPLWKCHPGLLLDAFSSSFPSIPGFSVLPKWVLDPPELPLPCSELGQSPTPCSPFAAPPLGTRDQFLC